MVFPKNQAIKSNPLVRLFSSGRTFFEVELNPYAIKLKSRGENIELVHLDTVKCSIERKMLGSRLCFEKENGEQKRTDLFFNKKKVLDMKRKIDHGIKEAQKILSELARNKIKLTTQADKVRQLKDGSRWLSKWLLDRYLRETETLSSVIKLPKHVYERLDLAVQGATLSNFCSNPISFRDDANRFFNKKELERKKEFFDSLSPSPNSEQRNAIICDENNACVVASAGSGKTTLILSKLAYLLEKRLIQNADEVMILSFNTSISKEIKQRGERQIKNIEARTFHSLGFYVLSQTGEKHPTLASFEKDRDLNSKQKVIVKLISEVLEDDHYFDIAKSFFIEFLQPIETPHQYKTYGEFFQKIREGDPTSYKKSKTTENWETVKSFGEKIIADALLANGVKYQYEKSYFYKDRKGNPIDYTYTSKKGKRLHYRPDFYLPDYNIWIEHFGTNCEGKPPPYFRLGYVKNITDKRKLHKKYKTTLIETTSCDHFKGELQQRLFSQLSLQGVKFKPISKNDFLNLVKTKNYCDIDCDE